MKQYANLCTQFYDLTRPEAGPKEIAFYEGILRHSKGPILEGMCGSGRLLIPLSKRGFVIDGVDNSAFMLESCKRRCFEAQIDPTLYNQSLQTLALPQKYDLIFIAAGSFQLIHNKEEALSSLKVLRNALLPGGRLVLETFIPWDRIKTNIDGSILFNQSGEILYQRRVHSPEGFEITSHSTLTANFKDQIEVSRTRFEKWQNDEVIASEEEKYTIRWYFQFELELFLEKAGYSSVEIHDPFLEPSEQALIYVANNK